MNVFGDMDLGNGLGLGSYLYFTVYLYWHADQAKNFSSILCEVPDHKQLCIALLRKDLA